MSKNDDSIPEILDTYPLTRGCAAQTFQDLINAQKWEEVKIIDLPSIGRYGFTGKRPHTDGEAAIIPCTTVENISISWLTRAFGLLLPKPYFYLAIVDNDSTIVYYKMSDGLIKPLI